MAARWFLGLADAGLSLGISYYLSCWYRRPEFGLRMAISFSSAALAGSFGELLAAGISKMDGVAGKPGWAWIFMLEGLATVALALVSFRLLIRFPDRAEFLSQSDKHRVIRRLAMGQQSSARHQEWSVHFIWAILQDWKTYTGLLIYMGAGGSLYAFALFLPTIVEEMVNLAFHLQHTALRFDDRATRQRRRNYLLWLLMPSHSSQQCQSATSAMPLDPEASSILSRH
jgi:MFS family permease